jgi:hypothetical protein
MDEYFVFWLLVLLLVQLMQRNETVRINVKKYFIIVTAFAFSKWPYFERLLCNPLFLISKGNLNLIPLPFVWVFLKYK